MPFGLPDDSLPRLLSIFSGNRKIRRIILCGWCAKGVVHTGSNIDFRLDGDTFSLEGLDELEVEIDDLLLLWRVDITVEQQVDNPDSIAQIERVGVRLYPN